MKIDYPTDEEMNSAITGIVQKAYPKKESVIHFLIRLYRHIGLEFLMHGMKEVLLVIGIAYVWVLVLQTDMENFTVQNTSWMVAAFSPLMFQLILALSVVEEREQNVYELGMTCKYTVYHLMLLRMFLVSGVCAVLNAILCAVTFGELGVNEFLPIIMWSVTSLFLYCLLYLNLLMRTTRLAYQVLLYGTWVLLNVLLKTVIPSVYTVLVWKLPLVCHGFLWVVMGCMLAVCAKCYIRCCDYNCSFQI